MIDDPPVETAGDPAAGSVPEAPTHAKLQNEGNAGHDLATLAWAIHDLRLRRNSVFPNRLFGVGRPGWDMLLAIYAAELRGRHETVSSLCSAAFVTNTTGIRWLMALEAEGWIARRIDFHDKRRRIVSLTPKSRSAMRKFLSDVEGEREARRDRGDG